MQNSLKVNILINFDKIKLIISGLRKKIRNESYIYIDTSIFIENNFFLGRKLLELEEFAQNNVINLYTTSITINEIKKKISDELEKAKTDLRKAKGLLNSGCKILKNIEEYKPLFNINEIEFEKELKRLSDRLNDFIYNAKMQIIPVTEVSIDLIFNKYFSNNPPFNNSKKKHEFPDAFVLIALEKFALENEIKIYTLSIDDDFSSYQSENLIFIKSISDLLDIIIHTQAHDQIIDSIYDVYNSNKEKIKKEILELIYQEIKSNDNPIYSYYSQINYQLDEFIIKEIIFWDDYIVELNDKFALLEIECSVEFEAKISYENADKTHYDKDDNIIIPIETSYYKSSFDLPVIIKVFHNPIHTNYKMIEIVSVNNDYEIEIEIYKL